MKAILVIDKPSSCIECHYSLLGGCYCTLTQEDLIVKDGDISENCPLKPLPQKKDTGILEDTILGQVEQLVFEGWNRCIDEILGGKE